MNIMKVGVTGLNHAGHEDVSIDFPVPIPHIGDLCITPTTDLTKRAQEMRSYNALAFPQTDDVDCCMNYLLQFLSAYGVEYIVRGHRHNLLIHRGRMFKYQDVALAVAEVVRDFFFPGETIELEPQKL